MYATASQTVAINTYVIVANPGLTITLPVAGDGDVVEVVSLGGGVTAITAGAIVINIGGTIYSSGINLQARGSIRLTRDISHSQWVASARVPGVLPGAMLALRTSAVAVNNSNNIVPFDTVIWSQGGMVRSGGGFAVPEAGVYQVSTSILWNNNVPEGRIDLGISNYTRDGGLVTDISLGLGGAAIMYKVPAAGAWFQSQPYTALLQASANDVLYVGVFPRNGNATIYGAANWTTATCMKVSE